MSKFCTNCGNVLNDDARFCGICGTPVAAPVPVPEPAPAPILEPVPAPIPEPAPAPMPEPAPAPAPVFEPAPVQEPVYIPEPAPVQAPVYQPVQEPVYTAPQSAPAYNYQPQQPVPPAPPKKKSKAGLIVVIIAIIAALAVAAIFVPWDDLFGGSSGGGKGDSDSSGGSGGKGSSVEDGVQVFMDVYYNFDLDQLEDLAPKAYWDYVEEETGMSYKDIKKDLEDTFEDQREYAEDSYGDYTATFKITDEDELSEEDLAYLAEALEYWYSIDADSLEAAVMLEMDMEVEGPEDSFRTSTDEAYMIKIDGKWYPVVVYLDEEDTEVEFAADTFVDMIY